jgi:hypothetical protein
MLYKQLQRITELDKQIEDMHARLAEYYRERAQLASDTPRTKEVSDAPASTVEPQALYDLLKAAWPTLPAYKGLASRLAKADKAINALIQDNHQLAGNLTVVAVPPQAELDKILTKAGLTDRYLFTEDYRAQPAPRSKAWSIIIVTGPTFALSVDQLSDSLGKHEFTYKQFDCRALGVREAIAADLQGLEIATDSNWTLLLKDATSANHVPCVTKQDDRLIFDIDDARCLLGNNYMQPAIAT